MSLASPSRKRWQVWSPAKINLSLHITGRRDDGYHYMESLAFPVNVFDRVTVEFGDPEREPRDIKITVSGFGVPESLDNLAARAALAFAAGTALPLPAMEIRLEKWIPPGAGLGGGSSNAAAILKVIQAAFGNPVPEATIFEIGRSLGSDLPFFLLGRPALMRGIGDEVQPVQLPGPIHLVLCSDRSVLLSKDVYAKTRSLLTRFNQISSIERFLEGRISVAEALHNDLEVGALALHPPIVTMKDRLLRAGAVAASMTGSGSCVFGVCTSRREAQRIANALSREGFWAIPAEALAAAWSLV